MEWIAENLGTILVCLVLIVITGAIVAYMIRNKKTGRSSCGCNCGSCPMSGTCQKEVKKP
ncbi:MAG: FeoB-associated Cys-rich membrane protein [Lachnospiraceae bacterium]|nr:FeoB-associated Cys-rich membrane protein [Lachnospiraceae bacterium]